MQFPGLRHFRGAFTLRLARGVCACGAVCKHSDRVQWTKQGAVIGCVAEALPAAETAEAEQGQPSKFSSGLRPAQKIWLTATRRSAPIFTRTFMSAAKIG